MSTKAISPPPANFRPAVAVRSAWISQIQPPFLTKKRRRGRRRQGEIYEAKVQKELELEFPDAYIRGPWLRFREAGGSRPRWCQPDGLLILPTYGTITLVEIKYQHTTQAWWQLKQLYLPVVAELFPPDLWEYNFLEIVKWHDPAVSFPERYRLVPGPMALGPGQFGVWILKP